MGRRKRIFCVSMKAMKAIDKTVAYWKKCHVELKQSVKECRSKNKSPDYDLLPDHSASSCHLCNIFMLNCIDCPVRIYAGEDCTSTKVMRAMREEYEDNTNRKAVVGAHGDVVRELKKFKSSCHPRRKRKGQPDAWFEFV